MKNEKRNLLVGIFALLGLVILGWLIFVFQQFPLLAHKYNSIDVQMVFPGAPGIRENTSIFFCGCEIGHVAAIASPQAVPSQDAAAPSSYQVVVHTVLKKDPPLPDNIIPKICHGGLSSSYIDLTLSAKPPQRNLRSGDSINGFISQGNQFISERTQAQLDELIVSLGKLCKSLQAQLEPITPAMIDSPQGQNVLPNLTTLITRMDQTLRNLNLYLDDPDNQKNLKNALADLARVANKADAFMIKIDRLAEDATTLVNQSTSTLHEIGQLSDQAGQEFASLSQRIQSTAEQITLTFQTINQLLAQVQTGSGSASKIINDPRLYEALTDAFENLDLAVTELRQLINDARQQGIKLSLW